MGPLCVTWAPAVTPPRAVPRPRPEPQPVPAELGQSLRTIGDPELKAVLEALAAGVVTPRLPTVR